MTTMIMFLDMFWSSYASLEKPACFFVLNLYFATTNTPSRTMYEQIK